MKGKLLGILLAIAMVVTLLCSSGAYAAKQYSFKIAGPLPGEWGQMKDVDQAIQRIEKRTNGNVKIKTYWDGVLGSYEDMLAAVVEGSIDMMWCILGPDFDRRANLMYIPYQVTNYAQVWELEKAPGGMWWKTYNKVYADLGVKLLAFSDMGFFAITNNKKPVRTLADLKGLKIRRMRHETEKITYESWGLSAVSMDFGELMVGLKTGVMDGQTNGAMVTYLYVKDVTKYYSDLRQTFEAGQIVMNMKKFNELPEEYRKIIQEEFYKHQVDRHAQAEKDENYYMKKLEEAGIKVERFTDAERKPFVDAARSSWPKCAKLIGQPLMDELNAAIKKLPK